MPIQTCSQYRETGYKWGKSGKCYTGPFALKKAKKQEKAIYSTGWKEKKRKNMTTATGYMEKQAGLAEMRRKKPITESVPCSGLASREGGRTWGVSCKREVKSGDFFVTTHRARSKGYKSLSAIPVARIRFVDSTG